MTGGGNGAPAASLNIKIFKGVDTSSLSPIYCNINEG